VTVSFMPQPFLPSAKKLPVPTDIRVSGPRASPDALERRNVLTNRINNLCSTFVSTGIYWKISGSQSLGFYAVALRM
jgi:hypothetical protein